MDALSLRRREKTVDSSKTSTVILARVSSKAQEDEGYSLDSQQKLLQGYCQTNGLRVVKIFKIAETASKDQSRKIFSEMLEFIRRNNVYNLAVEKTDRLTRNLKDAVAIDDWLNEDAARMLHAVKENLKVHKEARSDVKFMWNIHLAVAKKYTDNLREEAMKGWAEKLAQGWMPSRPPMGYMTAIQNGKRIHVPDSRFAPYISKAFEVYLRSGGTVESVVDFLGQAGVVTDRGRAPQSTSVHRMLHNPYYMGVIEFDGETYAGAHEPLVSKQVFKRVQQKLQSGRPTKLLRHDITLKGVITCGYCGGIVTWEKHKGTYYGACQRSTPECKINKYIRENLAINMIADQLDTLMHPNKAYVDWLIRHLETQFSTAVTQAEEHKQSLKARITRLEKMDEMLYDDKLAGDITRERYETKHADILKQLEELKDELLVADVTAEEQYQKSIDVLRLMQSAKDEFLSQNLTNEQKRSILTELFDSITLKDNFLSVKLTFLAEAMTKKVFQKEEE